MGHDPSHRRRAGDLRCASTLTLKEAKSRIDALKRGTIDTSEVPLIRWASFGRSESLSLEAAQFSILPRSLCVHRTLRYGMTRVRKNDSPKNSPTLRLMLGVSGNIARVLISTSAFSGSSKPLSTHKNEWPRLGSRAGVPKFPFNPIGGPTT